MKGKEYEERMEGLFPLSRMVAGGEVLGEEGKVLPSTSSMTTGMEILPVINPGSERMMRSRDMDIS